MNVTGVPLDSCYGCNGTGIGGFGQRGECDCVSHNDDCDPDGCSPACRVYKRLAEDGGTCAHLILAADDSLPGNFAGDLPAAASDLWDWVMAENPTTGELAYHLVEVVR